ncbi:MAG: dihydrolipoyl dehydrogenase [Candidatus Aenigmarchaeota archaeon]|nr:dihydrolipoyl dehydrogenase [Candidatus Aenigmarchaeota archaeon]
MYDAVVIGGGPAGYACALRVSRLGGKAAVIEKSGFGGTCTHRGCIPTKFLHASADFLRKSRKSEMFGIKSSAEFNYSECYRNMFRTVETLAKSVEFTLSKSNVEMHRGEGKIKGPGIVEVNGKALETKNIVVATGSKPMGLPGIPFDDFVLSSDTLIARDSLPSTLGIVGGGYIGCEFASILNEFGVKVTIAEALPRLLPFQDEEIVSVLSRAMGVSGIKAITGAKVEIKGGMHANGQKIEGEKILVAIGRTPNINETEMGMLGVNHTKKGIEVSAGMHASAKGVYAIGDVAGKSMLAHSSYEEAFVAASNIMGVHAEMDYSLVPECIFTFPEIAAVGKREGNVGKFPFIANSKAVILGEKQGLVKLWAQNGIVVGGAMVGPHATDMISEIAVAVKNKVSVKSLADTIHPHPTLSEAIQEAARELAGKQLHGGTK